MMQIPLGSGAEFDLIRRFFPPDAAAGPHVRVGAGDDCAIVEGDGLAVSADMSVEGVHFRREWLLPEEIGYRAAAAALSDLAAVAATPIGLLVSLALDPAEATDLAPRVMEGVRAAGERAGAVLLGGDLARTTGPLVIDAIVIGSAPAPVLRRGARAGDSLWVTGELGAAAAAVRAWERGVEPAAAARVAFALPTPRIAEAAWLAERGEIHALIDISDGLAGDAGHLAAASGVRIILDADAVPVHPTVRAEEKDPGQSLRLALTGGEDYELCFAAPPGSIERLAESFTATFRLPLTRVGSVEDGAGVALRTADGITPVPWSGHDHFASAPS
ncbi:MAG TPA: thiamine-phosphate kinase [Longimicrobiales bacterium]